MKTLTIGLDIDNVLFKCTELAMHKVNERMGLNLSLSDLTCYDFTNHPAEVAECFYDVLSDPEFYKEQEVMDGAKELVDALVERGHDIIFPSAAYPGMMGIRALRLTKEFPNVPRDNIMLGARKDRLDLDVLLDDKDTNLIKSIAKYPIAYRWPWNENLTGFISVENHAEFLALVDRIAEYTPQKKTRHGVPCIISLVGPSGSGKTAITNKLLGNPAFGKPKTHTTRTKRGKLEADYHFVTMQEFEKMETEGSFLETTLYAGNKYGLCRDELQSVWDSGRHAVAPIDIHGAMMFKTIFGERAVTVYIRRNRKSVIQEIVSRDIADEDKVKRILSLGTEYENEDKCDFTVLNNGDVNVPVEQIMGLVL